MQLVPQCEPVHAILSEPLTGLRGVEHSLPCIRTVDPRHAVKGLKASGSGRMRMSHLLLTSKRACMSVRVEAQKASLSFPQPRYASVLRMHEEILEGRIFAIQTQDGALQAQHF